MNLKNCCLLTTLLFSATVVAGCDDSASDPAGPDSGAGKADEVGAEAAEGDFVTVHEPVVDGCKMEIDPDVETARVTIPGDGSTIEFEADGDAFACDRDEAGTYHCDMPAPGGLPADIGFSLAFTDDDRFSGEMKMRIDCEGEQCEELSALFDTELPCESTGKFHGYRAQAEDFEPREGAYELEFQEASPMLTTCSLDVLAGVPTTMALSRAEDGAFTLDDGLLPLECELTAASGFTCGRLLPVPDMGLTFETQAFGAWTAADAGEGFAQVTVQCADPDSPECEEVAGFAGELPCVAMHPITVAASE